MSERDFSDSIHSKVSFAFLLFAVGVTLLWAGSAQYSTFIDNLPDYILLRPDHQTTLFFVLGASSLTAGLLGLIRGYLYR